MLNIRDVEKKVIDIKKSHIDWERSDPKRGIYQGEKVYYSVKGRALGECPWHFSWCRNDRDGIEPNKWRVLRGYDFVKIGEDFVPDIVPPNAEGHYVLGDLVLMKIPMMDYLKEKLEIYKDEQTRVGGIKRRFRQARKEDNVDVDEEWIARTLGISTTD